jgi:SAM-dependent methyltransferase
MKEVTVDLSSPSNYEEPDSKYYRFKRKLTLKPVLKIIRAYVNSQTFSLLEIGTGAGYFISFLESEFPYANLTGLEFDKRLVSLTQKKIKKARIIQGNAEDFDLMNETFDIIISLQVIEHLYKPELMLACVKKYLKPRGVFIFTTPNLGSFSAKFMKEKWHGYRADHVSLKDFHGWSEFLEKNGFIPIYCGSTFFSGIPILNKFPFGLLNWVLLFFIGHMRWKHGESFVGIFRHSNAKEERI